MCRLARPSLPFPSLSLSLKATYRRIAKVDLQFPDFLSTGAKDFIGKLLKHNPSERTPVGEVLNHTWLKEQSALYKPSSPSA